MLLLVVLFVAAYAEEAKDLEVAEGKKHRHYGGMIIKNKK